MLKNLNIDKKLVSDGQFAKFYKKNIASKTSLSQIVPSRVYELGGKTFNGAELKKAILDFQKSLISTDAHNEIVGYVPKIKAVFAIENDLKKAPQELLDFAKSEDLPIVLV